MRRRYFKDGEMRFRHNFVGTKGFVEEQAARKMIYKGAFAVGNPKGRDAQPGALVIGRRYTTERDSAPVQYNGVV